MNARKVESGRRKCRKAEFFHVFRTFKQFYPGFIKGGRGGIYIYLYPLPLPLPPLHAWTGAPIFDPGVWNLYLVLLFGFFPRDRMIPPVIHRYRTMFHMKNRGKSVKNPRANTGKWRFGVEHNSEPKYFSSIKQGKDRFLEKIFGRI